MKVMPDNTKRLEIINEMLGILREDAPWVWGFHPKSFSLHHVWNANIKPNLMANNTIKYRRIDKQLRQKLQQQWNQPILWPLLVAFLAIIIALLPAWFMYQRRKQQKFS